MASGLVSRSTAGMANNNRTSRLGDYQNSVNRPDSEDPPARSASLSQGFPSSSTGWATNIWGSSALGGSFSSTVRDSSLSRGAGSSYSNTSEATEARAGSSALMGTSEAEPWNRQRSTWGSTDNSAQSLAQRRSSGVSPARQRTNGSIPSGQSSIESVSTFYPQSRNRSIAQGAFDPALTAVTAARASEGFPNGLSTIGSLGHTESVMRRHTEAPTRSWGETTSLHSPTDERSSMLGDDYYGGPSRGPSRNGSLPPSRHGNESFQNAEPTDGLTRFPANQQSSSSRAHHQSFSSVTNGRPAQERSGSIQSDSFSVHGARYNMPDDGAYADPTVMTHRQSFSINSVPSQSSASGHQPFARQGVPELSQNYTNREDTHLGNGNTFTPEGYPGYGQPAAPFNRGPSLGSRGAFTPNGNGYRQSPYYSTGGTPPTFDPLYPSRRDPTPRLAVSGQELEQKLQLLTLEQQQQQSMQYFNPQFQHMLAAAQMRNPYGQYPYNMNSSLQQPMTQTMPMSMSAMGTPLSVTGIAGMMPMLDAARSGEPVTQRDTVMSNMLSEFKSNSKSSRRYHLKDIYAYIVEFSGDQHGSRFIQQQLETANSDEKERVFRELLPNANQLMKDVFGNYVIQKFFEHGDQNQKKLLANKMKGEVLALSTGMYGCRVVQKALEHVLIDQQAALVGELRHHVLKCVKDQNGNHVIQKAIERVPAEHIQFIIDSFNGQVSILAVHPYGCRVIQRVLEHCDQPAKDMVLNELHACGATLIPDQYGNYVTQHIIEHGSIVDRARIIDLVTMSLLPFSKHKFASNVVEKCLACGTEEQRRQMMLKVIEKTDAQETTLMTLIKDSYGNYVIQKLLDTLALQDYKLFLENLEPEMTKAKRTVAGKQVHAVERKMHRFDRHMNGDSSHDMSSTPTPPPLTTEGQSPPSSSAPSTSSVTDEPAQPIGRKEHIPPPIVNIAHA